jgi:NAD dependent epimerase/dehydratase
MNDTLNGKNILITGADGFIGSHLVEKLLQMKANVKAFVYYNSWNHFGWLNEITEVAQNSLEIISGDIRDSERVRKAIKGCDYVFHLSSLIAIPYSYHATQSYVETNVIGALNVLQACRESESLIRLIHVSTSEVYGSAQRIPIDENHPLVGQSPYSASKIGADKMAESFHLSFGLPVVTARPFNTFGPRQTARAVIPTIASQLLSRCEKLELGVLYPTRDFNFVTDTVDGLILLACCAQAEGQVVNIGSGEEWSIEQTAKLLMEVIGHSVPIQCNEARLRPKQSEVNRLLADNKKIKELTGWESKVSFKEGLKITSNWVRENLKHFNPNRYAL